MEKRERVIAAIDGRRPDHVPTCFSLHFEKDKASGEAGVASHLEFFKNTDTDVLKIMNENLVPYIGEFKTPDDWKRIGNFSTSDKFMTSQIDMTKAVLDECGDEGFTVGTLHGTVASGIHPFESAVGYERSREIFCEHLRQDPDTVFDALKRISEGMCLFAEKYIETGVDGVYYAALGGEEYYFTDEEFDKYIAPLDKMILKAVKDAGGYTFLHMCKDRLNLDRYESYADLADVVNWGVYEDNISLELGREIFPDTTIMGGLESRGGVLSMGTEEEITKEVKKLISEQGKKKFILGADCTLATDEDRRRIRLVSEISRKI